MKPQLKEKVVTIQYWDCGDSDHCHRTGEVALDCMQKQEARRNRPPILPIEKRRRWIKATRMVLDGHTYNAVGKEIGVSGTRIRNYVNKVARNILFGLRPTNVPEHDYYDIRQVREHKGFYLEQIEKLEAKWLAPPRPLPTLSTRVVNALKEHLNCAADDLTPETVSRIPLRELRKKPWIGKAATSEIVHWMSCAGFQDTYYGAWVRSYD